MNAMKAMEFILTDTRFVIRCTTANGRDCYIGRNSVRWGTDSGSMATKYGWKTSKGAEDYLSKIRNSLPKTTTTGFREVIELTYDVIPVYYYSDGDESDYGVTRYSYNQAYHSIGEI